MVRLAAVVMITLASVSVRAGQTCETAEMTPQQVSQGLALAQRTVQALNDSGAEVVVLARAGQDLSRYGLRWSHLGLVYREAPATSTAPAVWRVLHKLNTCGKAEASIYRQGLGDFFLDAPHRYEAVFMPLDPALQQQLLPWLKGNLQAGRMHSPAYSMLAYPFATQYQQSNQWALETLAAAASGGTVLNRQQAQAWLLAERYVPGRLHLDTFTRLGARITQVHVAFDDHPPELRWAGKIDTTTVESVLAFLRARQLAGAPVNLSL
jgi:hypothetical protein